MKEETDREVSVQGTEGAGYRREGENWECRLRNKTREQGVYLTRGRNGLEREMGTGLRTGGKWARDKTGNRYRIMVEWS